MYKKAKKRGRPATTKNQINGNAVPELFKLETGIPLPPRGGHRETAELKQTAIALVEKMEIGNSFVCRNRNKISLSRFLRDSYPKMIFRVSKIPKLEEFARVFRVK